MFGCVQRAAISFPCHNKIIKYTVHEGGRGGGDLQEFRVCCGCCTTNHAGRYSEVRSPLEVNNNKTPSGTLLCVCMYLRFIIFTLFEIFFG